MTTAARVSVLMTVFNREQFITEAIESVMASTFEDFELIITDDQSTDSSVEMARSYAEKDKRVRVEVNDTRLGDYPNRNRAAALASGEYLKYVDADDYLYPTGLQVLVSGMESFPDAGYGLCSLEQDAGRPFPFQLSPREAYLRHYFGEPLFHKAPLSSIIRRDAFRAVGGFSGRRSVGDFEMWHKLSARFPVVLMPGGVVWYRVHDEQESKLERDQPLEWLNLSWQVTRQQLADENCPLDASEVKRIASGLSTRKARLAAIKAARFRPREFAQVMRLGTSIVTST